MAARRLGKRYWGPVDKEYLNELISVERGWVRVKNIFDEYYWRAMESSPDKKVLFPESGKPLDSAPDWTSDHYWPLLVREGEIAIEWTKGLAVAYFIKADLKPTRGKEIGEVVVRAWARLKGLVR